MKEAFIFNLDWRGSDKRPLRLTVVFFPKETITDRQFRDLLQQYLESRHDAPPDLVLLIGTEAVKDILQQFCHSILIKDSIPSFTRYSDPPPLRAICMTKAGTFAPISEGAQDFVERSFIAEIQKQGMLAIASGNVQTVIESVGTVHYVKPSGEHTNRFIRAANALVRSSEIAFIALWLVPFLTGDIDVVYTDTAGIDGVVFNAILLKVQNERDWKVPYVDSFSSYRGLETYSFTSMRKSLFVISASTSGKLANQIRMKLRIDNNRIITLFYLGSKPQIAGHILCDMSKSAGGFTEPATNYAAGECTLCQSNIPAVSIDGDQFLLGHLEPHSELIQARNAPDWLNHFMAEFYGKGVLRAYRSDPSSPERSRELFIDLRRIYEEGTGEPPSELLRRLDRKLNHCIPVTLQQIIYINDPSSKALAERIQRHLQQHRGDREVPIIPHTSLPKENIEKSDFAKGTLLLVAGALVTGQRMMSVNQILRNRSDDSLVYLVGLTRTRDEERLKEIRSNIEFARDGSKHPFFSIKDIYIPDDELPRELPWDVELRHWKNFKGRIMKVTRDHEILKWVEQRKSTLRKARPNGLLNELFLPAMNGARLALRPGFAFWNFPYKDIASQADVYFSVAAILHSWREEHARRVGDFSRRYGRVVISPKNFYRFNDGIIQACILRAADRGELDYRYDDQLSVAMSDVLAAVFSNFDNSRGEGTLEFLLALLVRQLNLRKTVLFTHVAALEKRLKGGDVHARIGRQLCAAILEDVEKRTI